MLVQKQTHSPEVSQSDSAHAPSPAAGKVRQFGTFSVPAMALAVAALLPSFRSAGAEEITVPTAPPQAPPAAAAQDPSQEISTEEMLKYLEFVFERPGDSVAAVAPHVDVDSAEAPAADAAAAEAPAVVEAAPQKNSAPEKAEPVMKGESGTIAEKSAPVEKLSLFMTKVKEFVTGLKWQSVDDWFKGAITAIGVIGALRGTAKVVQYFSDRRTSKRRFENREYFDALSCNLHVFTEEGGRLKLGVYSVDNPHLSRFIPNQYAEELFVDAAKSCTPTQPFPSLNFVREKDGRLAGLNRTNKFLRESFSSRFGEGALAHAMGLPTRHEKFILVPICEVFPLAEYNFKKFGKALIIVAITERDFQRFGDEEQVNRMHTDDTRLAVRIRNLRSAYKKHVDYGIEHGKDGHADELFPRVTVFYEMNEPPEEVVHARANEKLEAAKAAYRAEQEAALQAKREPAKENSTEDQEKEAA